MSERPRAATAKNSSDRAHETRPQDTGLDKTSRLYITNVVEAPRRRFFIKTRREGELWYEIKGRNERPCVQCIKSFTAGKSNGACWAIKPVRRSRPPRPINRCKRCIQDGKCHTA